MASGLVWRFTNNSAAFGGTAVLAGLGANQIQDVPFHKVAVRWANNTPYTTGLEGNTSTRFYIQNQSINIKNATNNANNDFTFFSSSNQFGIARAQLIEDGGAGNLVWDSSGS